MKARKRQITPEVVAYRDKGPLKRWLDADPQKRPQRRALLMKKFGVSKATLHHWINGSALPTPARLLSLCAMIGCSAGKYIEWFSKFPTEDEQCGQERW